MLCEDVVFQPQRRAASAPPSAGGKQPPEDLAPLFDRPPAKLRARPGAVPGSPSPPSAPVPVPPPGTRSFSFNAASARVRRAGRPSRLLLRLPFPLPPEFQVNGSPGRRLPRHTSGPPFSASGGVAGTAGKAGRSAWDPCGVQQVGLARAGPRASRNPAGSWRACSGAAAPVGGPGREGGRGGGLSPLSGRAPGAGGPHSGRCARQVSALLGSLRPQWVGPGCSEQVRGGRGAGGALHPRIPVGGPRCLGVVGEARGKARGTGFGGGFAAGLVRGASRARLTWRLRPGAWATWRRRPAPRRKRFPALVPGRRGQLFGFGRRAGREQ